MGKFVSNVLGENGLASIFFLRKKEYVFEILKILKELSCIYSYLYQKYSNLLGKKKTYKHRVILDKFNHYFTFTIKYVKSSNVKEKEYLYMIRCCC